MRQDDIQKLYILWYTIWHHRNKLEMNEHWKPQYARTGSEDKRLLPESGERIKIEEPLSTQTDASPSFLLLVSKKFHAYLSCGSISNVQTLLQYMTSHYEITPHAQHLPTFINSSHHQPITTPIVETSYPTRNKDSMKWYNIAVSIWNDEIRSKYNCRSGIWYSTHFTTDCSLNQIGNFFLCSHWSLSLTEHLDGPPYM